MEKNLSLSPILFHKTPKNHNLFSSKEPSFHLTSSIDKEEEEIEDEDEVVMRGLSSDRLIFDTGGGKSSLLIETTMPPFDGGVAVAVDSTDPFGDFKVSMEEMVEAHGVVNDWTWLQEMLGWFLRANGKGNHGYIISAFLDLVVSLASSSSFSSSPFESCPLSSSSSSSYNSSNHVEEMEGDENG